MMIKTLVTIAAALLLMTGGYSQKGNAGLEQRLTMITLGVKDLRVSEQFYCEKLGWRQVEPADGNIVIIPVVKKPQRASWGGYSGYIRDPDGNLIEIAYNPFQ